ncbi:hypothetical protein SYK_06760 [Pseudodesulfovibrio nedwellii]|uniref:Uncharacterized protein n=1 Tax=Pseudodesulfovibrio nedwellii TaxID=2973072 RepID=A0ABM8AY95_9BACT|nr:hypothetical protein [Pseudodesulfovibrio nedwellii]BDQ35917.1 hypothetical protein SYK_02770 [Pseudodesulfovibrio nedwellii]BDQ36316.1 hypothetical protein SYK_06760 [Pseudodesulfovibrio nedwellii]
MGFDPTLLLSPVLGLIGGAISAYQTYKTKKLEFAHEKDMAAEDRKTRVVEAKCEIEVTREKFDGEAYLESQKQGNQRLLSSEALEKLLEGGRCARAFGGFIVFLFGIVDVVNKAIRPAMLIYMGVKANTLLAQAMLTVGGASIAAQLSIVDYGFRAIFSLFSTAFCWFFADRTTAKALNKKLLG